MGLFLAGVLAIALVVPAVASTAVQSFNDVSASHWAHDAIEAANADGVMTGTAPWQFSTD